MLKQSPISHFALFKIKVIFALNNALRKEYSFLNREFAMKEEKREDFSSADNIEDLLPILEEREAMKKLPAHYRRMLEYRLCGYSVTEIAADMGVSHQAVSKRIKNALKQLRELIKNE